jgi:hypothetical protein
VQRLLVVVSVYVCVCARVCICVCLRYKQHQVSRTQLQGYFAWPPNPRGVEHMQTMLLLLDCTDCFERCRWLCSGASCYFCYLDDIGTLYPSLWQASDAVPSTKRLRVCGVACAIDLALDRQLFPADQAGAREGMFFEYRRG